MSMSVYDQEKYCQSREGERTKYLEITGGSFRKLNLCERLIQESFCKGNFKMRGLICLKGQSDVNMKNPLNNNEASLLSKSVLECIL